MNITELFDILPFWGFFLVSFIVIYGSSVIGLYLGKWRSEKLPEDEKSDIGPVVTACSSLLAFLLAMVFGAVYSRYNKLKHVVLDEANAIGTAFIRADLLPEADRTEVKRLLLDYKTLRLEAMQSGDSIKLALLLGLAFLSMAIGGYKSGLNSKRCALVVTLVAAVAYSVVITFVFELDRSHDRVSMRAPMIDLKEDIRRSVHSMG